MFNYRLIGMLWLGSAESHPCSSVVVGCSEIGEVNDGNGP